MKLVEKTVEVQTNMTYAKSVPVGISAAAIPMVIERLIKTYKNPYLAALREYTSNAYDEHVTAGVTRPVEVNLPNPLSPVLTIQDFGRGLTSEELEGYGLIGESTKRDSNDTTGAFGMGSKCALAAAPSFTVISIKNGKRNTVNVSRDEKNIPHMNFLEEQETDGPTGTTVIIPISDVTKFGDLTDFWVGWKPGTILIDDEPPKRSIYNPDQFRTLGGGIAYNDLSNIASGRDMLRVVINQVYYNLSYQDLGISYNQRELLKYNIIRIDNGTVEIAPSRETLLFDARTKAAIAARMDEVLQIASKAQKASVSNAATLREALLTMERMRNSGYSVEGLRWQKTPLVLPGMIIKDNRVPNPMGTWCTPNRDHKTKSGWKIEKQYSSLGAKDIWRWNEYTRVVIVHSASEAVTYGQAGRRANPEANAVGDWMYERADSATQYVFFITSEPLNRINRVYKDLVHAIISADEFNEVAAKVRADRVKEAKELAAAKRAEQKVKLLESSYKGVPDIDEYSIAEIAERYEHTVILRNLGGGLQQTIRDSLTTQRGYSQQKSTSVLDLMRLYKVAVILVGKNDKLDDVLPLLPDVTTFEELALKRILETTTSRTVYEAMALRDRDNYSLGLVQRMNATDIDKIKRKETREWMRAVKDYRDEATAIRNTFSWFSTYSSAVSDALKKTRAEKQTLPESPYKRYPLLGSLSTYSVRMSDVVDYINLCDKARKKG